MSIGDAGAALGEPPSMAEGGGLRELEAPSGRFIQPYYATQRALHATGTQRGGYRLPLAYLPKAWSGGICRDGSQRADFSTQWMAASSNASMSTES